MELTRFVRYANRDKAEGFIDGVEWSNAGGVWIKDFRKLPNKDYAIMILVENSTADRSESIPEGWEQSTRIDYGGLDQ